MMTERRELRSGVGFPCGLVRRALWPAALAAALTLGCAKEGTGPNNQAPNQAPAAESNGETDPPSDSGGPAAVAAPAPVPSTAPSSPTTADLAGAAAEPGTTSRGFIAATAMPTPPMPPLSAPPPVLITIDPALVGPEQAESVISGGTNDQAR